jgi:hypothetical protein
LRLKWSRNSGGSTTTRLTPLCGCQPSIPRGPAERLPVAWLTWPTSKPTKRSAEPHHRRTWRHAPAGGLRPRPRRPSPAPRRRRRGTAPARPDWPTPIRPHRSGRPPPWRSRPVPGPAQPVGDVLERSHRARRRSPCRRRPVCRRTAGLTADHDV